jgi:rRNA-processing protein FCF1
VIGVSKLDMAAIGTDEQNRFIEGVTAGNTRHAEDALLVSTAKRDGAVLVTNERRLANRCQTEGVPASTPKEFLERVAEERRGHA